ncbi:MAG: hypothetical protein ACREQL_09345 [Candidatus Binatia bacterium]
MQYPSNAMVAITALTDTAQTVFAAVAGSTAGTDISVIHLSGGAAAEIVIFRAVDDSPEYFRVKLAILEDKWLIFPSDRPLRIAKSEGLEVITASAAADVDVQCFFFQPGAQGIGVTATP